MSELVFHYGTMNSGKSSRLIQMAHSLRNETNPPKQLLVIKPGIDTKGENFIVSRPMGEQSNLHVDIMAPEDMDLYESIHEEMDRREIGKLACILTDESQFFKTHQIEELLRLTKVDATPVHAFGIKTDYRRELFEGSKRLLELAPRLDKIPGWCRCGNEAEYNCRYDDDTAVFSKAKGQISIENGIDIKYVALCYDCYEEELGSATGENAFDWPIAA